MLRFNPSPNSSAEKKMILCCRRCEHWQELPTFLDQYKNTGTCNVDIELSATSKPTTKDNHICGKFESKLKLVFEQIGIAPGKAVG